MRLLNLLAGDPNALLSLSRQQVAGLVIQVLNSGPDAGAAEFNLHNFCLHEFAGYDQTYRSRLGEKVGAAWQLLLQLGVLAPKPEDSEFITVTNEGRMIVTAADFEKFAGSALSTLTQPVSLTPGPLDRRRPRVFISHAYADRSLALRFKDEVQKCYPSVPIFCSSDPNDLPPGSKWENEIEGALRDSEVFLLIATSRTFERRWIWFEAGGFWFKPDDCPFVSLCFGNQLASDLPSPMSKRQALKADDPDDLQRLFGFLTTRYGQPDADVDFASMARTLHQLEAEISSRSILQSSGNADQVGERWVDLDFPNAAGLSAKWEAEGYRLVWAGADEEARRTQLEGWEYALYPEQNGSFSILRIKDRVRPLVLLKKKQT